MQDSLAGQTVVYECFRTLWTIDWKVEWPEEARGGGRKKNLFQFEKNLEKFQKTRQKFYRRSRRPAELCDPFLYVGSLSIHHLENLVGWGEGKQKKTKKKPVTVCERIITWRLNHHWNNVSTTISNIKSWRHASICNRVCRIEWEWKLCVWACVEITFFFFYIFLYQVPFLFPNYRCWPF